MDNVQTDMRMDELAGRNFRGLVRAVFEGGSERIAALWSRTGYENLRAVITDATREFEDKTNIRAEYAYVATLPKGIENGHEFNGILLFTADWMAAGYVFICARARGL